MVEDNSQALARDRQLALAFPLRARARFEDLEPGTLTEAVAALHSLDALPGRFRACLLWGAPATGKTHLLQAACRAVALRGSRAMYLPLAEPGVPLDALEGLEHCELVALDDLQVWIGQPDRERALVALYQGLYASGGALVVALDRAPLAVEFTFPDLASRVRALPSYALPLLGDEAKRGVLRRLGAERGLDLPSTVLDFWFARGARDLATLIGQLEELDAAAWTEQRRITVPLLKSVLGL
ncbi:MAG: HdaA/DnaA family protein [Pseudomonadales bacterium]